MPLVTGRCYTRRQIHDILGGSEQAYLPTRAQRVLCGAFRMDVNPDAPTVILPGLGVQIRRSAEIFARQAEPVPVFIKRRMNEWEYIGRFRVQRRSTKPAEIERYAKRAQRYGDVSMVLFLAKEDNGAHAAETRRA